MKISPLPATQTLHLTRSTRTAVLASACLLLNALSPPALTAQPATEPAKEQVVILSPFIIASSQYEGYQSQVTLSGAGMRVSIDEIGSAVSVITPKFLEDTASRDLRDALVHQVGIEVGGFGGNFAGSTNEPALTNNVSTRVRGLAAADLTRGFFRSAIPNDAYNTARVDINRGANALLFGVGSPAGIINYSTVEALTDANRRQIGVSADNYGSVRGTLDINQVLVPRVAAIRIAALNDEREYRQKPAFNHDQRLYGSFVTSIPAFEKGIFSGTRVTLSGEVGKIDANNPRNLPPQDHLSGWFEETRPAQWVAAGIPAKGSWNPSVPFAAGPVTNLGLGVGRLLNRSPIAIFVDPTNNTARDPNGTVNGQTVLGRPWVSNNVRFPNGATGAAVMIASRSFEFSFQNQSVPLPDGEFYIGPRIMNPEIFDFHDRMLDGPNKREDAKLRDHTVTVEQLLFNRRAGIELSANSSSYTESTQSLLPIATQWLAVDANTHTWDGTPNPNFGRVMTGQPGTSTYSKAGIDTVRAKAFYELDLTENDNSLWRRIAGKHTLGGLMQRERNTNERRSGALGSTTQLWENGSNQNRQAELGKTLVTLNYLTPSAVSITNPANLDIRGIEAYRLDLPRILNGQGVFLARLPPAAAANSAQPQHAVKYQSIEFLQANDELTNMAGNAEKNRRTIDSSALSLQSRFLDGHIIGTYGLRKEEVSVVQVVAPVVSTGENYRLVNDPAYDFGSSLATRQKFKATPKAWSVVAKLPNGLRKHLPATSALSVFYGESENFDPPESTARNVFGDQILPPRGISTDYGINLRLFDERLSLRVTRYETNQDGSFNGSLNGIIGGIVTQHVQTFQAVQSGFATNSGNGFPVGYVAPPQSILDLYQVRVTGNTISQVPGSGSDTSDYIARGTELELFWSPTSRLSLSINAARQESTRDNSGEALRRFMFETPTANGRTLAENWSSPAAQVTYLTISTIPDGTGALSGRWRGLVQSYLRVANSDGGPATELRKWRSNAFANYVFDSGRLKNIGIGGAVRYQGKVAIGLPIANFRLDGSKAVSGALPGDFRTYDISNPYFGPGETSYDCWLSYKRHILRDKIQAKFQLNVRNVFADDDIIPIGTQPDGTVAVIRIGEPTTYTLSARFEF